MFHTYKKQLKTTLASWKVAPAHCPDAMITYEKVQMVEKLRVASCSLELVDDNKTVAIHLSTFHSIFKKLHNTKRCKNSLEHYPRSQ